MNTKTNSARDSETAKCVVLSEYILKLVQLASCLNPTSVKSCRRVAENLICVSIWFLVALRNKFSILCFIWPKEFRDRRKCSVLVHSVNVMLCQERDEQTGVADD